MRAFGSLHDREWVWGLLAVAALTAIWLLDPGGLVGRARETAFDVLGGLFPRFEPQSSVVVVDIDRESLARIGPWPWRRGRLADLVTTAAEWKPRAIALDILLSGRDRKGPAALARELADALGPAASVPIPSSLPNDDRILADAIATAGNVVLGLVLDDEGRDAPPFPVPLAVEGEVGGIDPWRAEGLIAPYGPLWEAAAGTGVLSFQESVLGRVASAPVLAVAGADAFAGLALEAVRVAEGASLLVLKGGPARVVAGPVEIPIDPNARMRLSLSPAEAWAKRTVPAWRLLSGDQAAMPDLAGKIVLIGSSAPEAGALLPLAATPLAPTVQIQAEAVEQMLGGRFLTRPVSANAWEPAAMAAFGLMAVALAARLPPAVAAASVAGLVLLWLGGVALAFVREGWLLDPIGAVSAILVGANVTAFAEYRKTRALKAAIEQKFERYLAPEIVARLVREPETLRLDGELRDVTALVTDVEGFSEMTERADPRTLVHALDAYFDGLTELIVGHGGMVDKIVGDSVLAFFNIPADLPEHTDAAVRCAKALLAFTAEFRRQDGAAALGFGRTRCGVEAGEAIVGDVGGRRRLDYTAYGVVVNKASRFEEANKRLGSSICIGPVAARRLAGRVPLRCLGRIQVRGMQERCEVFEPWDEAVAGDLRRLYAEAVAIHEAEPERARRLFSDLSARLPDDAVMCAWLERLKLS